MVAVVSSDDTVRARRVPVLAAFVAEAACRVMFVDVAVRARAAFWTVLVAARVRAVWGAAVVAVRETRDAVAVRAVDAFVRVVAFEAADVRLTTLLVRAVRDVVPRVADVARVLDDSERVVIVRPLSSRGAPARFNASPERFVTDAPRVVAARDVFVSADTTA